MRKDEVIAFAAHLTRSDKKDIEPIYKEWRKSYELVKRNVLEPQVVENVVFEYFHVKYNGMIYNKIRDPSILYIRQLVQYFLSIFTKLRDIEIGFLTGGFDRTTIPNSIKAIENYCDTDRFKEFEINEIEQRLKQHERAI